MLRTLDLFSGIGGFSLGLERTNGFRTVAFCEIDPFARRVLAKHWPEVPCYDDVRTPTAERLAADGIGVDVICGGFPCQDASIANVVGQGTSGERTGLFSEIIRLARDLAPRLVIMENVAELLNRGFGNVLGALADIGFDAEWRVLRALDCGLPHLRSRVWIVAYPSGAGRQGCFEYLGSSVFAEQTPAQRRHAALGERAALERDLVGLREADGVSVSMERRRLHGLGNAVTPKIPTLIGRAILAAEAA